jgi:hypothetical protein
MVQGFTGHDRSGVDNNISTYHLRCRDYEFDRFNNNIDANSLGRRSYHEFCPDHDLDHNNHH